MLSEIIGVNFLFIFFAYFIGSINFSIILSKLTKKDDIRTKGSFNPGATNAARNYGLKFGLAVFVLDVSKSFWIGMIGAILRNNTIFFSGLIVQLSIFFVIVGHVWPIYFKFKGGKGAATNLGMITSLNFILAIVGAIIFFFILYRTKFVSLGSFLTPFLLAPLMAIPFMNSSPIAYVGFSPLYPWYLSMLFLFFAAFLILYTHRANIKRLIQKNENKFKLKKI